MDRWILVFLVAGLIGVGALWGLFFVARTKDVKPGPDGRLVLRHSTLFKLFGFFLFVGLLSMLGVLAFVDSKAQTLPKMLLAVFAALTAILGLIILWDATQYSLTIDSKGLEAVSPWRGPRTIPWADIKQISFSEANLWFAIEPTTGPAFHILAIVPGVSQFLASCEAHLPVQKLLPAEVGYSWVWRTFPPVAPRDKIRKPRLMKFLKWSLGTVAAGLLFFGILFVTNGTMFASGETPVIREIKVGLPAERRKELGQDHVLVMTYNIAKAFAHIRNTEFDKPENVIARLDKIAAAIQLANPDIVCLQEIMTEAGRMPIDQVEYLARATNLPYTAFGENYNFGIPGYRIVGGNAILSRTPLKGVTNLSLVGRKPFYKTENSRRALFAETELMGQTVLIGSLHNDSFDMANNDKQVEQILNFIGDRACILAGDFNANPNTPPMLRLESSQKFSGRFFSKTDTTLDPNDPPGINDRPVKDNPYIPKTFPTHAPDQHLDFVLAPKAWTHLETSIMRWPASDHLPVFAVFATKKTE